MSSCYLSVVIPAYNEARRLPATLTTLNDYLSGRPYTWEVIVADDGSEDSTPDIVHEFARTHPGFHVHTFPHRGKGAAVKQGMLAAHGEYRFLCDADLSMPIEHLSRLLPPAADVVIGSRESPDAPAAHMVIGSREAPDVPAADIVIGSREAPGARRIGEPRRRHLMGRVFNVFTRLLATPGIADTQCGFKVFNASAATALFPRQTLDGFAFDAEILFLASRRGFTTAEVGIDWHYRAESKVRPFRDGWRTLRDLLLIRWRWLTRKYD